MFTGFYTTDKGHQYIAKALAGSTLVLTTGQFGNGMLPEGTDVKSLTALISPLGNLPISKQKTMNNSVITTTQFTNFVNGSIIKPFHFMEAGLFGKVQNADGTDDEDAPETLLFYAYEPSTETADYIPETLTEFFMNWPLTISESANVTVQINDSLIYMTMDDLKIASEEEAIAGTDNTKLMTPLRVSNYVDKILGDINIILDSINGEVI